MRKSFHKNTSKLQREEKRKQRNLLFMSVFLIFILVSSLFGYAFFQNSGNSNVNTVEEYGQTFRITNVEGQQVWQTKFDDEEPYFFALPSQVEGYYSQDEALAAFTSAPSVALTFDPLQIEPQLAQVLLSQFYDVSQDKIVTYGVTQETTTFANVSAITCADANPISPVLYLGLTNQSNMTGILIEDNCISVQGFNSQELFFMTEKLRYAHHGIDFSAPTIV